MNKLPSNKQKAVAAEWVRSLISDSGLPTSQLIDSVLVSRDFNKALLFEVQTKQICRNSGSRKPVKYFIGKERTWTDCDCGAEKHPRRIKTRENVYEYENPLETQADKWIELEYPALWQVDKQNLRSLRACTSCSLVKPANYFEQFGCENCSKRSKDLSRANAWEHITSNFDGLLATMETDPEKSWTARWQQAKMGLSVTEEGNPWVVGTYAISVEKEETESDFEYEGDDYDDADEEGDEDAFNSTNRKRKSKKNH